MGLGNTGNMQMEEANSKVQIVGTTYEYLGDEASLNAIIETYEKVAGTSLQIKKAPGREGEVKRSVANIGKLIKLGYTTKWSLEAGLSKYWEGAQQRESSRN